MAKNSSNKKDLPNYKLKNKIIKVVHLVQVNK